MRLLLPVVAVLALSLNACGGSDGPYVIWETIDGVQFATRITDENSLHDIRVALEGDGHAGIPNGKLVRGDGGFNRGHEWHLVDVMLADMAIEVCDGTASMVDADVDYWVDTVGQYCPWDARVVAITDSALEPWPES